MTLDEAISHAEEMAKLKERDAERWNWHAKIWSGENRNHAIKRVNECTKCSEEHYQLSEWLRELKQYKSLFESPKEAEELMNMYMV